MVCSSKIVEVEIHIEFLVIKKNVFNVIFTTRRISLNLIENAIEIIFFKILNIFLYFLFVLIYYVKINFKNKKNLFNIFLNKK
jgi:hypothetical protein